MKSYLQSYTFWTGIGTIALAALDAGYQAYTGGGDFRAVVLAVVGALIVVLRKRTKSEMVFAMPQKTLQLQAQKILKETCDKTIASDPHLNVILEQRISKVEQGPRE